MRRSSYIVGFLSMFVGFALSVQAEAAVLYPFSHSPTVPLNETFTVEIRLDSENEVVNAVETSLVFDASAFEVVELSQFDSLLTLWPEPPRQTEPGKISLTGGRPDGTVAIGGRVASVVFRSIRLGSFPLAIQPSLSGVYLNDGQGTAVSLSGRAITVEVVDPTSLLSQPTSPTHPVSGVWSNRRDFVLNWIPLKNVSVSYRLSRDQNINPDTVVEENTGQTFYPALSDGVWYLTFIERLAGQDWSDVLRREVWIDATPPQPFALSLVREPDSRPYLVFAAQDNVSGVTRYTARIERSQWWTPWAIDISEVSVTGPLEIPDVKNVSRISVTAFDAAGNSQTASLAGPGRVDARWMVLIVLSVIVLLCAILFSLIQWHPRRRKRRKL